MRKPTQVRPSRRNYRNATGGYGRWTALNSLGPVIYAIQLDDGVIKIGWTTDLAAREKTVRQQAGSEAADLLAFQPGSFEDEKAIHATLVAHRAHGHEYYHPTPEVLAVVNDMRSDLNLPLLAA